MKKNKLFEVINDIDERYIHEAGDNTGDEIEESYAEITQSGGHSKIRFAPIAKIAACIALVGAVPAIIYSVGNPDISSPLQSGVDITANENTDVTEEPTVITDDFSEGTQITEDNEAALVVDKTSEDSITSEWEDDILTADENEDETGEMISKSYDDYAEEIEAAIAQWNDTEKINPVDELVVDLDFRLSGAGSSSRTFVPAAEGTEVKAAADGKVVFAGAYYCDESLEFAYFILIKHNSCVYTSYMWLDKNMNVMTGDEVTKGQVIGATLRSPLDREGNGFDFGVWSGTSTGAADYPSSADYPASVDYPTIVRVGEYTDSVYRELRREDIILWRNKNLVTPVENVPDYFEFDTSTLSTSTSRAGNASVFIPAEAGTEIRTVDDGEVVFAGFYAAENDAERNCWEFFDKNVIIIKHNTAVYTAYYGISDEMTVKEGDTVTAGQVIGYSYDDANYGEAFVFMIEGPSDRMHTFHSQHENEIIKAIMEKGMTITKRVGDKIEFEGKLVDSADF